MNRYEKRHRELVEITNEQIRRNLLVPGSPEYQDRLWLIQVLERVGKTYKKH